MSAHTRVHRRTVVNVDERPPIVESIADPRRLVPQCVLPTSIDGDITAPEITLPQARPGVLQHHPKPIAHDVKLARQAVTLGDESAGVNV